MQKVYDFLKKCKTYYLATVEDDQARVRPFGTIDIFDGRLCFQTGKSKSVSKQIHKNPKIEICAFADGTRVRIQALAIEEPRIEAQIQMLKAYPELKRLYTPGDGNTEIFYLKDGTATFSSFTGPQEIIHF